MPFLPTSGQSPRLAPSRVIELRRLALAGALAATLSTAVFAASAAHRQQPTPTAAAEAKSPVHVTLSADGKTCELQNSTAATVGELLKEQNVKLTKDDRCSSALSAPLKDGLQVSVTRVRSEYVTERTPLSFPVRQKYVGSLPIGRKNVLQAGKNGERAVKYLCFFKDDKLTEKQKMGESVTAPRPQIEQVGTRGMTLASRGYFTGRRVIEMVATGYGPGGNGKWGAQTASGLRPGFGVVAVDPRFIPLGTRLYVDGYGYAVAGDTGGAIKGNRIDLGHDTNAAAAAVGRKKVRVLILD